MLQSEAANHVVACAAAAQLTPFQSEQAQRPSSSFNLWRLAFILLLSAPRHLATIDNTIDKVGNGVNGWKVGQRVAVGWYGGHRGDFLACSYAQASGISNDGGYADYTVAPIEAVVSIPILYLR